MAEIIVNTGTRHIVCDSTGTLTQATTDTATAVTGGNLDARSWRFISFTLKAATNGITWGVFGANAADFSDESQVQNDANVASGAVGTFTSTAPPFSYYRAKIKSQNAGQVGTATVLGFQKP